MKLLALLALALAAATAGAEGREVPPSHGQPRFPVCGASADPAVPVCREEAPALPPAEDGAHVRLDGNRLIMSYQGEAKEVQLSGELVPEPMPRVADKRWLRVLRIAHPEQFYLEVGFMVTPDSGEPRYQQVPIAGPAYVAAPPSRLGATQRLLIESKFLNEARGVRVWLSPNYSTTTPAHVVYIADGAAAFALRLTERMRAGDLPPLVVVGLEPCRSHAEAGKMDCRNLEYENVPVSLHGEPARFSAHEQFFLEEVMPEIEKKFNVSTRAADRAVAGFSGGADWAASMVARHPALFSYAIVMSPSFKVYDVLPAGMKLPPVTITAGLFEPDMVRGAGCLAGTLAQAGAPVRMATFPYGHSQAMWQTVFQAQVLGWLRADLPAATPGLVRAASCHVLDHTDS